MRIAVDLLDTPDSILREQITADVEESTGWWVKLLHYVRAGYRERRHWPARTKSFATRSLLT